MADEFVKGLGLLTGAGLIWMVLAGWYRTPSFEGEQLIGSVEASGTVFDQIALITLEVAFWLAIIGAVMFWVVVPALSAARERFA